MSLDYDSQPGSNFTSPIPEGTEAAYGVYSRFPDAYAKHEDAHVTLLYEESAGYDGRIGSAWRHGAR